MNMKEKIVTKILDWGIIVILTAIVLYGIGMALGVV
jgi:hypothetical protein